MKLSSMMKAGAVVQVARMGLNRRRRSVLKRQRRNRALGMFALVAGGVAAWFAVQRLTAEQTPEWPSKKKLAKEARRAEAAKRAQQANVRPAAVHVEKNAPTELKASLGDVVH